jgi:hypothetical protein
MEGEIFIDFLWARLGVIESNNRYSYHCLRASMTYV